MDQATEPHDINFPLAYINHKDGYTLVPCGNRITGDTHLYGTFELPIIILAAVCECFLCFYLVSDCVFGFVLLLAGRIILDLYKDY